MSLFLWLVIVLFPFSTYAADWTLQGTDTLIMSGKIQADEAKILKPLWTKNIHTIVVKDSTNSVLDLSLGKFLKDKEYTLVVQGFCSQNCVENLVLPATTLRFEKGCLAVNTLPAKIKAKDLVSANGDLPTQKELEKFQHVLQDWKKYGADILKMKGRNANFYADPTLDAKGLVYFPSSMTLMHAGFKQIYGDVDLECVAHSGLRSFYYK